MIRTLGLKAALVAVAALGLSGRAAAAAPTQSTPNDDPYRQVLAVVSPITAPACALNGTATLLLPIVLGPDAGNLALDSLVPMFIVCGTLPSAPGSRCQLDGGIIGLWPDQAKAALAAPAPVGTGVDVVGGAGNLTGIDGPAKHLNDALRCQLPQLATAPAAPPVPPEAPRTPTSGALAAAESPRTATAGEVVVSSRRAGANAAPVPSGVTGTPVAASTPVQRVSRFFKRTVPGGILALQILSALVLAAFLGSSWTGSLRLARTRHEIEENVNR